MAANQQTNHVPKTYTAGQVVRTCILTVVAVFLLGLTGVYLYLRFGNPPVAVADTPFPREKQITHIPLDARIDRDMQQPPLTATPAALVQGATVYMGNCAVCHGTPGINSQLAKAMYPTVPQLWVRKPSGVVGASDDPAGESYWKVQNGIRLAGMPAFQHLLNNEQMWQVSLLVAQADKPQSSEVLRILATPTLTVFDQKQTHP